MKKAKQVLSPKAGITFDRPLVFFDLETTGPDKNKDRVVQIGFVKMINFKIVDRYCSVVNPEIAIPESASKIHGVYDEDVRGRKNLAGLMPEIKPFIESVDLAGFNSNNFDIPLLYNDLIRVGYQWDLSKSRLIDVCNIYKQREERTLSAAVQFYLGRKHDGAHSADMDAEATSEVFLQQLSKYGITYNPDELDLYSNFGKQRLDLGNCFELVDGVIMFKIGKNKGTAMADPYNRSYLEWMVSDKANFHPHTVQFVNDYLNKTKLLCQPATSTKDTSTTTNQVKKVSKPITSKTKQKQK